MRKRMIDPDFWLDEELAKVSVRSRLLFIGLWNLCDDNYATFPNKPDWIKVQVFPYERVDIQRGLDELSANGRIIKFTSADDGKEYYFIKNFFKYQKIDRPSAPKYKKFPNARRLLDDGSVKARPEVNISKDKLSKENIRENSTADGGGFDLIREKIKTLGLKN